MQTADPAALGHDLADDLGHGLADDLVATSGRGSVWTVGASVASGCHHR
jgi:hypothetical protein